MTWLVLAFIVILSPIAFLAGLIKIIVKIIRRNKEKPKREKPSFSAVMFIVGTLLVMFSGVAFGVAGWVKTTSCGRVGIIILAVFISFIAGTVFHRIKLDGTSSAFFSIGNFLIAVSVITAGFYRILGNYLTFESQGLWILMSLSVSLMAVSSYIEYKILKKNIFEYFGFISASLFIIFITAYFSRDYDDFSLFMVVFQSVITAVVYIFDFKKTLRNSMIISAIIYSFFALIKVTDFYFYPDAETYFIFSAITLQLIIYVILLKKPYLKALQSVSCVLLFAMISCDLDSKFRESLSIIIFSYSTILIYVANRFIPQIKNKFSEIFTFFSALTGVCIVVGEGEKSAFFAPVIMSVLIMLYAFSEKKSTQIIFGIISPVLPIVTALEFAYSFKTENIWFLCIIFLSLITALIIYLPVYAFKIHAKYPLKTDVIIYSDMLASGIFLIFIFVDSPEFKILFLLACAVHFMVTFSMKNNFTAFFSALVFISLILEKICENLAENSPFKMFLFFCILMIISRTFFHNSVIIKKEKNFRIDILMFSSFVIIPEITENFGKFPLFFSMVASAVFVANLIRKNTSKEKSSFLLSVSAFIMAFAFVNRPFFLVESPIITSKITLGIFAVMGISYKYIWKNNKKISEISSQTIFILDFIGLIFDVIYFYTLSNTVFVLALTAVILIISFTKKSRIWFFCSSSALVIITVYSMKNYITSLDWWAYLFIVGLALIAVASANEYCKKSGKNIKIKLSEIFSDWKW